MICAPSWASISTVGEVRLYRDFASIEQYEKIVDLAQNPDEMSRHTKLPSFVVVK
jgi:hypothetical protein